MKRMYATLGIIFILVIWAINAVGNGTRREQDEGKDWFERRWEKHEKMHRQLRERFFKDFSTQDDFFSDMDSFFDDSFFRLSPSLEKFKMNWKESDKGRTLILSPKSQDQTFDINVEKGMITIKSKEVQSQSTSSYSHSFNVPRDCDETQVKITEKKGDVHVFFPFKKSLPKAKDPLDRRPIGPSEDEVTI